MPLQGFFFSCAMRANYSIRARSLNTELRQSRFVRAAKEKSRGGLASSEPFGIGAR
jgi:hypothetical protein